MRWHASSCAPARQAISRLLLLAASPAAKNPPCTASPRCTQESVEHRLHALVVGGQPRLPEIWWGVPQCAAENALPSSYGRARTLATTASAILDSVALSVQARHFALNTIPACFTPRGLSTQFSSSLLFTPVYRDCSSYHLSASAQRYPCCFCSRRPHPTTRQYLFGFHDHEEHRAIPQPPHLLLLRVYLGTAQHGSDSLRARSGQGRYPSIAPRPRTVRFVRSLLRARRL